MHKYSNYFEIRFSTVGGTYEQIYNILHFLLLKSQNISNLFIHLITIGAYESLLYKGLYEKS